MNPDPEDVWSSNILITKNITTVVNLWLQTIVDLLQGYPNQNLGFYLMRWWFVTTASENWQPVLLYDEKQDCVCQIRVPNILYLLMCLKCVMSVSLYMICVILCVFLLKLYIFCQLSSIFDIFLNGYRQANRLYYMHVWLSYVSRSMCDLLFQKFARDFF